VAEIVNVAVPPVRMLVGAAMTETAGEEEGVAVGVGVAVALGVGVGVAETVDAR
jgi:hypothetical protein